MIELAVQKCPYCEFQFKNFQGASLHVGQKHKDKDLKISKLYLATGKFELKYCKCGCGKEVKIKRNYINGHGFRGKKFPEKSKEKLRYERTEETRKKISITSRGRKQPNKKSNYYYWTEKYGKEEADRRDASYRKKQSENQAGEKNYFHKHKFEKDKHYWYGKKIPDETRKKISNTLLGSRLTAEQRENFLKAMRSPEYRKKRSEISLRQKPKWISETELSIVNYLKSIGIDIETQKPFLGKYRVDIFVEKLSLVIEVNGCYFHCCKQCFPNKEWRDKRIKCEFIRNRDLQKVLDLEESGVSVLTIWEHSIVKSEDYKLILDPYVKKYLSLTQ